MIAKRLLFIGLACACLHLSTCLEFDNQYSKIPPGPWRAVLQLDPSSITPNPKGAPLPEKLDLTFEEVTNGELPFTFEVTYTDEDSFYVELINGEERIIADKITFGHTREDVKDTIRIDFPVYDTYIVGRFEEDLIEGQWVVNYRDNYSIPFVARFGQDHRFTKLTKTPAADLSGRWEVTFGPGGDESSPYPAIAEFIQTGNDLTGTFITETGDYRFLEGTVQGNKLYLSVFDGAHAFLFEALIQEDGSLVGSFRSGKHYRTIWTATRNSEASLTDPDELTFLNPGYESIAFSFPNTEGQMVSLDDPEYEGKPKLIQIMGTWCPNCRDETNFLKAYLSDNPNTELEVISLAFERYRDADRVREILATFKENLEIPYPVLHAGYYQKSEAVESLPMLNHILSYPTLIFLDRNNQVTAIHTGFNGPATSEYDGFVQYFDRQVARILATEVSTN